MRAAIRVVVALAVVGFAACKKSEESPAEVPPPPLTEASAAQMRDACAAYVAHVCGCADEKKLPELEERCELARAIPEALDLAVRATRTGKQDALDQRGLLANANRIQKSCIEESARLETTCPRVK